MELSLIFLIMFSIISIVLFFIRYKENRNVLLFGKIASRLLVAIGAGTTLLSGSLYVPLNHIMATIIALIVSDILYDFAVLYLQRVEKEFSDKFHDKFNKLLDNLETPALILKLETGEILYKNQSFIRSFSYDNARSVFEIDKKFPLSEGKFSAYIGGKQRTVINFVSKNSINTLTVLIY